MKKSSLIAILCALLYTGISLVLVCAIAHKYANELNWLLIVVTSVVSLVITFAVAIDVVNDLDDDNPNKGIVGSTAMLLPIFCWLFCMLLHAL